MGELVERGVSERMACQAVGLSRSSYHYRPGRGNEEESARIRRAIVALAHEHRRYGYRRITALLRRQEEHLGER